MSPPKLPPARPLSEFTATDLLRTLYVHNPFYLLSAGLVLYGLRVAFRPNEGELINPWALMGSLCGFTLLLAATAVFIVRWGKVWDDARSLLLVLLLQFLAVSTSFDEMLNSSPSQGYWLMLFGMVFSTVLSEALFHGLKLRLPWLYRGPYYAILMLFFIYPPFVSPETTGLPRAIINMRILAFPLVAGFVFLSLIFAIRRGARFVRDNGTPWSWPWFPWTAFAFLAIGVCLRSFAMTFSLAPAEYMDSIFGLYFLVPFLFALLILVLEMGLVEKQRALQKAAVYLAPAVLLFAIPFNSMSAPYNRLFLERVVNTIGSPLFLTIIGLAVFYAYSLVRRVRHVEWGLGATLLLACFVGQRTIDADTLVAPQWYQLAFLGTVECWLAIRHRSSVRTMIAAACGIAALSIGLQETSFVMYRNAIPLHLLLGAALLTGLLFDDPFARFLRKLGAIALAMLSLLVVAADEVQTIPLAWRNAYAIVLLLITAGYGILVRDRWYFPAGGFVSMSSLSLSFQTMHGYWHRTVGEHGFLPLFWGAVCFFLAFLISAVKAGLFDKYLPKSTPDLHPPDSEAAS